MKLEFILSLILILITAGCLKRQVSHHMEPIPAEVEFAMQVEVLEMGFEDVYADFTELTTTYNYHLSYLEGHEQKIAKRPFEVHCIDTLQPDATMTLEERIELLNTRLDAFRDCASRFKERYNDHIAIFHTDHLITDHLIDVFTEFPEYRRTAPLLNAGDKLALLDEWMKTFRKVYEVHLEEFHP